MWWVYMFLKLQKVALERNRFGDYRLLISNCNIFKKILEKAVCHLKRLPSVAFSLWINTPYILPGKIKCKEKVLGNVWGISSQGGSESISSVSGELMFAWAVAEMFLNWGYFCRNVACLLKLPWFITTLKIKSNQDAREKIQLKPLNLFWHIFGDFSWKNT